MKTKPLFVAILLILFLTLGSSVNASDYHTKKNEKLIFGFTTLKDKKTLSISMAKDKKYLVYRYGKKGKIEFEFPTDKSKSFTSFTYSYLFRGGGQGNLGIDLNWFRFVNANYQYTIYSENTAEENSTIVGIKIKNLVTKKVYNIEGNTETVKGSLVNFRFMNNINTDDFILQ